MAENARIYIWYPENHKEGAEINPLFSFLSPDEARRAEKMEDAGRRFEFVRSRALLKKIFGTKSEEEQVYNISHSEGVVAIGVGDRSPLGIDIEIEDRHRDILSIIRRYGAKREIAHLKQLDAKEQISFFYKLWTLKESYAKATRKGLNTDLKRLEFDLVNNRVLQTPSKDKYIFHHFYCNDLHVSWCDRNFGAAQPKVFKVIVKNQDLDFQESKEIFNYSLVY